MHELLDKVQVAKENAVTALFNLQVKNLKSQKDAQLKRSGRLNDLRTEATVDIARTYDHYTTKEDQNNNNINNQKN